ncbi:MAG TPA: glycosyltransferase family 4 protein [Longimicrobiaceae bacterium]|nr:glycosyltransferase family 4 protein [Longimicrobiaceae bacterium]
MEEHGTRGTDGGSREGEGGRRDDLRTPPVEGRPRLCVLSVAYPLARVGRDTAGGAEQVLSLLDSALVRLGHRSIVVAAAGSTVAGELIEVPLAAGEITDAARREAHTRHRQTIRRALAEYRVDLVHMHGVDFHAYLPEGGTPVLVTLHLPPSWYPPEAFRPGAPNVYLHCVSEAQQRACPVTDRLLRFVPNGVPVGSLGGPHARRGFSLMLARVCPEKGIHLGLDAARRAGVSLLVGGEVYPYAEHRRYFADQVLPRLDRRRRFLGPVGFARKRRLLAAARCVLIPSLAPETSSLVAMEAIASGTPVVAFRSGALPEVVEHGRTGFLVADEREMADAIGAVGSLDPEACREAGRARFSAEVMARRYVEQYARVLRAAETACV